MGYQRGQYAPKQAKTSDRQSEPSTLAQNRPEHPVDILQAMFGSRAASRQIRAGNGVANLVGRSRFPVSPRTQGKPLFRGISQEWSTAPATGLVIQPKLTIGAPNDRYEQEADRVAEQVVQRLNVPAMGTSPPNSILQRETLPDDEGGLHLKPVSHGGGAIAASDNLESAIQQSRGSGQPLAESIRKPMEQAFGGVDFSGVKVHTDTQADQLNRSIQSKAFTNQQDIYFRQGDYAPGSRGGQALLAHELTHVVQQKGGASSVPQETGGELPAIQRMVVYCGDLKQMDEIIAMDVADNYDRVGGEMLDLATLQQSQDDHHKVVPKEVIVLTGHGLPGSIEGKGSADLAQGLRKVDRVREAKCIYVSSCYAAATTTGLKAKQVPKTLIAELAETLGKTPANPITIPIYGVPGVAFTDVEKVTQTRHPYVKTDKASEYEGLRVISALYRRQTDTGEVTEAKKVGFESMQKAYDYGKIALTDEKANAREREEFQIQTGQADQEKYRKLRQYVDSLIRDKDVADKESEWKSKAEYLLKLDRQTPEEQAIGAKVNELKRMLGGVKRQLEAQLAPTVKTGKADIANIYKGQTPLVKQWLSNATEGVADEEIWDDLVKGKMSLQEVAGGEAGVGIEKSRIEYPKGEAFVNSFWGLLLSKYNSAKELTRGDVEEILKKVGKESEKKKVNEKELHLLLQAALEELGIRS